MGMNCEFPSFHVRHGPAGFEDIKDSLRLICDNQIKAEKVTRWTNKIKGKVTRTMSNPSRWTQYNWPDSNENIFFFKDGQVIVGAPSQYNDVSIV